MPNETPKLKLFVNPTDNLGVKPPFLLSNVSNVNVPFGNDSIFLDFDTTDSFNSL